MTTALADRIDELCAVSPDIDRFCSSSAWILSAREAFAPEAEPFLLDVPEGVVALVHHRDPMDIVTPYEAMWGLASPFLGPDPRPLVEALAAAVARRPRAVYAFLGHARGGAAVSAVAARFGARFDLTEGPPAARVMARLDGGPEGFLSRRSAKFRANARRARRAAAAAGWAYELLAAPREDEIETLYGRALAIEARSWKREEGILAPPMRMFYQLMLPRLAARGRLRALFVRRGDEDAGYAFAAVFAGVMRGLQASYDERFARDAPGVLLHLALIERACAEGLDWYDLGTDGEYKRRWGEERLDTLSLIARPRR